MASISFPYNRSTGKLEEFLTKLPTVGTPDKIGTAYPASIGFGSSHARSFPVVLKHVGLLDSAGVPTDVYKKGLRGGTQGRALVGEAIQKAYKPMFDTYPDAATHSDGDLVTFVRTNSSLDDEQAGLVIRTFKVLCKFGDFNGSPNVPDDDGQSTDYDDEPATETRRQRRPRAGGSSNGGVVINVNIALSVDATSDPAVYDAFFAAMAKHLGGLADGA